jgi:hypothetical protein
LQTDSDFAGFVVGEMNAGLFKNFLYLEDRGEISFHNSFILLDPLKGCQADTGGACELTLAPAMVPNGPPAQIALWCAYWTDPVQRTA